MEYEIKTPLSESDAKMLRAGDIVYLTGTLFSARDAAHKRMTEAIEQGGSLPFDLDGASIYYMGPSPAGDGMAIGSAGPTTAGRMDKYTPELIKRGLRTMIGKGRRSEAVVDAMKKHGCVYLAAVGGAGALLSQCIKECETIAYEDLGAEAIRKMRVERFPVIVAIDTLGESVYK